MRLGDLDELKKQFDDIPFFIGLTGDCVQKMIDDMPIVEAAPVVHAKWKKSRIPVPVYGGIEISCSSCGRIAAHEYNYCPHCGAKMDGE